MIKRHSVLDAVRKIWISVVFLGILCNSLVAQTTPISSLSSSEIAQLITETPRAYIEVALSPDGRYVAYSTFKRSVEQNTVETELLLQGLTADGSPSGQPKRLHRVLAKSEVYLAAKWRPDGRAISYFGVRAEDPSTRQAVVYDVDTGQIGDGNIEIKDPESPVQTIGPGKGKPRPRITTLGNNYRWSPSGKYIAFRSALIAHNSISPDSRRGTVRRSESEGWVVWGLFVLNVASGEIRQLTPDTMSAEDVEWSSEGVRLVFSDHFNFQGRTGAPAQTQIRMVDVDASEIRDLVTQPGRNEDPAVSPDGKWVSFTSDFLPVAGLGQRWPAVVEVATGKITRLSPPDGPNNGFAATWAADSRSFYFSSWGYRMSSQLVRADMATKSISLVNKEDNYTNWPSVSFSNGARRVACIRSTFDEPQEIYIQDLPDGKPKRISSIGAGFALRGKIRTDRISWKSKDGTTVHGFLLTPSSAWDGSRIKGPLPTVAYNYGGPMMVSPYFGLNGQEGMELALAVRGYAVLLTNTRSRSGYGDITSTPGERNYRLSFEDVMSGFDHLVQRGVADPARLGAGGHSYGANLMTYLLTHTDRLRSAQLHEATTLGNNGIKAPGTSSDASYPSMYGFADPFSAEGRRIIADYPRNHLGRIRTPTLVQFGTKSYALPEGAVNDLQAAMQRLKVPHEVVAYDYGHAADSPATIANNIVRVSDWFDYWLRDMPYPDKEREKEYNAWKAARAAEKENTAASTQNRK